MLPPPMGALSRDHGSSNEAAPHLLADIITLERQEEAVIVSGDREFS